MVAQWLRNLVHEHGGWIERGADEEEIASFPSVEQKDQFVAAVTRRVVAMGKEVRITRPESSP